MLNIIFNTAIIAVASIIIFMNLRRFRRTTKVSDVSDVSDVSNESHESGLQYKRVVLDLIKNRIEYENSLSIEEYFILKKNRITPTEKKNETRLFIFIYLKTMF